MQLGNFSISLAEGSAASRSMRNSGSSFGGDPNWLIMQNDTATIGLFQGMFDKNTLTFNPGWDRKAQTLEKFEDVRDLQKRLLAQGVTLGAKADEHSDGPAHIFLLDPDGNPILIDQHVPRPKK